MSLELNPNALNTHVGYPIHDHTLEQEDDFLLMRY